jgi:2-C-methyl-D-erythritol 4-phosphate cytidylyltransferase
MKVTCIVAAAGKGRRFGAKRNKPFVALSSMPILAHTLKALEKSACIDDIIVVVARGLRGRCRRLIQRYDVRKVRSVVAGGRRRYDSVRNGLLEAGTADIVLVHDGARPFIDEKLIRTVVRAAQTFGAALCALPVKQTLKKVSRNLLVEVTPDRKYVWEAQTPQGFRKEILEEAYRKSGARNATDDAALVERTGHRVKIVKGSHRNIKITTPEDYAMAEVLLNQRPRTKDEGRGTKGRGTKGRGANRPSS